MHILNAMHLFYCNQVADFCNSNTIQNVLHYTARDIIMDHLMNAERNKCHTKLPKLRKYVWAIMCPSLC